MKTMASADPINQMDLNPMEVKSYNEEGWLLLPNLLNMDAVDSARKDVHGIVNTLGADDQELHNASGAKSRLLQTGQYLNGSTIDKLVNSEKLQSVASQLLGGNANLYFSFTAVKSGGGGGKFHFHQDNNHTRFTDGMDGINIWFALVDMTPENGCLCVQSRSHLDGTVESQNAGLGDGHQSLGDDIGTYLPVRMRAGDAIAFSRITVHGSGANSTPDPRYGYSVHFHKDDVQAVWDDQPPRTLKDFPRWSTAGVDVIVPDTMAEQPN